MPQVTTRELKFALHRMSVRLGYHSCPSFLIIGAQKSGTSALYWYLSMHPQIMPAARKELDFFSKSARYAKGERWYHAHFPYPFRLREQISTFDATPNYLYYPSAMSRIAMYNKSIKMIVLLRHPVERAYSHWNMIRDMLERQRQVLMTFTADVDEPERAWFLRNYSASRYPDFDELIREELELMSQSGTLLEPSHIRRGLYYDQLSRFFEHFSREQIMVLDSRLLRTATAETLNRVAQFVGVAPHDWGTGHAPLINTRPYGQPISEKTRRMLQAFYQPHNERLYELLEYDFQWDDK